MEGYFYFYLFLPALWAMVSEVKLPSTENDRKGDPTAHVVFRDIKVDIRKSPRSNCWHAHSCVSCFL